MMFNIGGIVKWVAIASIVATLGIGVNAAYNYYLDQIEQAVNSARLEQALELNEAQRVIEEKQRVKSAEEKKNLEKRILVEKNKVDELQRMLLIDHDLDRLLQRKPGLILIRVNKGTEEYYKKLEEVTQ